MAENTGTLNQSLDRRRDEKAAEHMIAGLRLPSVEHCC